MKRPHSRTVTIILVAVLAAISCRGADAATQHDPARQRHHSPKTPSVSVPGVSVPRVWVPRVSGHGNIHSFIAPKDRIHFDFDARGLFTDAHGTFHLTHWVHTDGFIGEQSGTIDCLVVGGHTATMTGIVKKTNVPSDPGERLAFSVEDNGGHGRDRMGFSWGVVDNRVQPKCMAIAPFAPVIRGHYQVHEGPLPNPPTWIPPANR